MAYTGWLDCYQKYQTFYFGIEEKDWIATNMVCYIQKFYGIIQ